MSFSLITIEIEERLTVDSHLELHPRNRLWGKQGTWNLFSLSYLHTLSSHSCPYTLLPSIPQCEDIAGFLSHIPSLPLLFIFFSFTICVWIHILKSGKHWSKVSHGNRVNFTILTMILYLQDSGFKQTSHTSKVNNHAASLHVYLSAEWNWDFRRYKIMSDWFLLHS